MKNNRIEEKCNMNIQMPVISIFAVFIVVIMISMIVIITVLFIQTQNKRINGEDTPKNHSNQDINNQMYMNHMMFSNPNDRNCNGVMDSLENPNQDSDHDGIPDHIDEHPYTFDSGNSSDSSNQNQFDHIDSGDQPSGNFDFESFDTSSVDSNSIDSSSIDSNSFDSNSIDSSSFDSNSFDSNSFDSSSFDSSSFDTNSFDSSSFDSGSFDSGSIN
jgi:hypothetical protein